MTATGLRYEPAGAYDEVIGSGSDRRPVAAALWAHLCAEGTRALVERQRAAEAEIRSLGVTFGVYDGSESVDRPWPFDVIPRILDYEEWDTIETGIAQRQLALNRFIDDVYHDQACLAAGVVPSDLVLGSPNFRPECVGAEPAGGIWAHICGSDLVRDADGTFFVLEDNLRVPSGVSYLIENRSVAKHVFPEAFRSYSIEPVDPYIEHLGSMLASLAPSATEATVVVLTPGIHNSAYFEHSYLAQNLGVELAEGSDLCVTEDGMVCMRTIDGLEEVDVVYRRVDDLFLDPEVFRGDSLVGVPGIIRAWKEGKVALVNAPGCGVADDKNIYAFVPEIIRYFLGEEPILSNVPTYRCSVESDRNYVLGHLTELVVKPANESGGYGVVVGSAATEETLSAITASISESPNSWVAQPILNLSTVPTVCDRTIEARHVDLRPFSLLGPRGGYVTRGGLTRVARTEGSLIVNSSQGGGSKDTWVVDRAGLLPDSGLGGYANWTLRRDAVYPDPVRGGVGSAREPSGPGQGSGGQ